MHGKLLVNQILGFGIILERSVNKKNQASKISEPLGISVVSEAFFLDGYNKLLNSFESFFICLFLRMTF